jgi:serine protease
MQVRLRFARRTGVLLTIAATAAAGAIWMTGLAAAAQPAAASPGPSAPTSPPYVPGAVIVGYQDGSPATARTASARSAGAEPESIAAATGGTEAPPQLLRLRPGVSVPSALARLRASGNVSFAVPDYIARASGSGEGAGAQQPGATVSLAATGVPPAPFIPQNAGSSGAPGGWQALQWNFTGPASVEAPQAWGNLIADHAEGGSGVVVAVLDTGVAYRNWKRFRRSPGFRPSQFVRGRDFVDLAGPPVDHNGHGTFVAGEIAETTNVRYGLPGLAYGVRLMPVRVLDSAGEGDALTIAEGIRYAVGHHAQIINLSLEFPAAITAADVPELTHALRFADQRHVLVVAAAGNDSDEAIPYPARAAGVLAVGASTEHGCLADYSNFGHHIALVAPGGGPDADLPGDPGCHPEQAPGRDIFQVTFLGSSPRRFGLPSGYEGTSMATPEVAATAALTVASGVLGKHPTPEQLEARLKATARPLGAPSDHYVYGAGLLDAAAATATGAAAPASAR